MLARGLRPGLRGAPLPCARRLVKKPLVSFMVLGIKRGRLGERAGDKPPACAGLARGLRGESPPGPGGAATADAAEASPGLET